MTLDKVAIIAVTLLVSVGVGIAMEAFFYRFASRDWKPNKNLHS